MPATSWIAHVKATHKKMGGTYKAAMMAAKKTWKKKKAKKKKASKNRKKRKLWMSLMRGVRSEHPKERRL